MNSIVRRSERKTKTVQYFQRDEGDDVDNLENEDSDWEEAATEETRGPRLDNIDSEASETSCGSVTVTPEKRGHLACSRSPRSPRGRPSPRKRQRKSQPMGQEASQWNLVTDPDIEPQLPRFCPARKPGVQLDSAEKYSYLELFQLFFDHSVVKTLCENTNRNADRMRTLGRKCPWEELTVEEFYRFLGLVIFMGLLKISAFKDYWSHHRVYRVPFCRTVMKRKRFDAIMWTLHLSDPAEDEENRKKRGTPDYDRLFCLRPLLDSVVLSCQAFYHPRQNLSIDERMVGTRARNTLKQHLKSKPTRWGFKLFVLADASNGYTCNFSIYQGRSGPKSGKGIGYNSVMKLINIAHLGTGYHLYVDSFYSSVPLFRDLYRLKIGACGTTLKKRQGFPRTQKNALNSKSDRGEIRWIRDNELLFVMWKDIRQVCMLSTIHTVYKGERAERRTWTQGGVSFMQPIPVPTPVKAYNQHMGGVDLSDALIKYYNVSHKTKKWYKTFFFHFVDIAVVNAFLLHKDLAERQNTSPVSQKVFREELCLQLVGAERGGVLRPCSELGLPEDPEHSSLRVKTKLCKHKEEKTPSEKLCFPVCITEGQVVDTRDKATKGRKTCVLCLKEKNRLKTIWKCVACDVPLCVVPDRNCFRDWHLLMTKEANKDGITEDGPQSSKKITA